MSIFKEIQERDKSPKGKTIDALMVEELNEVNFEAFQDFLKIYNECHNDRGELLRLVEWQRAKLEAVRVFAKTEGAYLTEAGILKLLDGENDDG